MERKKTKKILSLEIATLISLSVFAIAGSAMAEDNPITFDPMSLKIIQPVEFEVSTDSAADIHIKDGCYELMVLHKDGTVKEYKLCGKEITIEDQKNAKVRVKPLPWPGKAININAINNNQSMQQAFTGEFYQSFLTFTFDPILGGGVVTVPISGDISGYGRIYPGFAPIPTFDMNISGPSFNILGGEAESGDFNIRIDPSVPINGTVNLSTGEFNLELGILLDAPNMRIEDNAPIPFIEKVRGTFSVSDKTTPPNTTNEGEKAFINTSCDGTYKVLIGETLNFGEEGVPHGTSIIGVSPDEIEGKTYGTTSDEYDTKAEFTVEGLYRVEGTGVNLSVDKPRLDIEIQNGGGKSIDSTTVGEDIAIGISTNLFKDDVIVIKKRDPDGHVSTIFGGVLSDAEGFVIDTDGWKVGRYTLWVETFSDGDYARGLDIKSAEDTIAIHKEEIDIEAETRAPPKEKDVLFTVRASPYKEFNFETTHPEDVTMTTKEDNPTDEPTLVDPYHYYGAWNSVEAGKFTGKTDEDGVYKFVASFTEDRTYTFRVWYDKAKYTDAETSKKEDIDIDVGEIEVTIDVPRTACICEDVTITVTAAAGDDVDIVIGDILEFDDEVLVDGEAEVEWDTAGKTAGSYTIEVFVNCDDLTAAMVGTDVEDEIDEFDLDADETETIRLINPGLTAEQPRDVVAEEDDYVVEGTATGVDQVDIVIIGPDGFDGGALTIENGLVFETESVDRDNHFEAEIDTTDADSGRHTALVFVPGRDGGYGITPHGDGSLEDVFDDLAGEGKTAADCFKGKNKAQIICMIRDATVDEMGSDDLMVGLGFTIEPPYVELDPIESVAVRELLCVSGTTNRESETLITISTFAGPVDLPAVMAEVEWPTKDEGVFNATINTTDAVLGTYTIEADDGDGHTDTVTVEIVTAVSPSEP